MAQTAEYQLVDPTDVEVNESHVICKGQCPRCKVFWSEREDQSCACFSPDARVVDKRQAFEMNVRQTVMSVIKSLGP
jgi:hypothetical protein